MKKQKSLREELLQLARTQYDTEPECLWTKYPTYAVLRHKENRKWYAVFMNIPKEKLGLSEDGYIDILDVKVDSMLAGSLLTQQGFYPGYHMNKASWITILLDGTVKKDMILSMLDMSFELTNSKKTSKRNGPRITNWLIPANPKFYDIEEGLANSTDGTLLWKQSSNIMVGDTIYLYVAAPISAVRYQFKAVEVDLPYEYSDENLRIKKAMRLELLHRYDKAPIGMDKLKEHGVYSVRGPRSIPKSLMEEIKVMYHN